jgi:hypothetical protein
MHECIEVMRRLQHVRYEQKEFAKDIFYVFVSFPEKNQTGRIDTGTPVEKRCVLVKENLKSTCFQNRKI